jgi:membrane-associated phospholipid phosphatase
MKPSGPSSTQSMQRQGKGVFLAHYTSMDVVNTLYFMLLAIVTLVYRNSFPVWKMFIAADVLVLITVALVSNIAARKGRIWNILHGFYMLLCIPVAFKQLYFLVPAIHPVDYDNALILIDRALFGGDPTQWMAGFSHPVLTEILQLAYASFYFLPLILAVDLYRRRRMKAFRMVFMTVMLGFYLSYIGYVAVPGIGPRFTLHDFDTMDEDLPGLLLTTPLRDYSNAGESIPVGTQYPASKVQRDVFPSGHTLVTLLVMYLAFRYRARPRWLLAVVGTLLIISTVYLWYHYVIDLLVGVLFAVLTVQIATMVDEWWTSARSRLAVPGFPLRSRSGASH